jgi:voltage-gated sodium channel
MKEILEHPRFTVFITAVILINAITLGLETSPSIMASYGHLLHWVDAIALGTFVVELLAKLISYRLSFFKSGWNIFDALIVGVSLFPAAGAFSVLRAFRIFRVLRLFSVVPQMRKVIEALLNSLPGMASVVGVLVVVFYVSAVLVTKLFGASGNPQMHDLFGSIGTSMYTLFQIMTLESWSDGVVRPAMEVYPLSWLFFIPFIIVTSFAVLNLFIGVIVEALNRGETEENPLESRAELRKMEEILAEIRSLRAEIEALKSPPR